MQYWGKVIGGIIGLLLPIKFGLLIGVAIGHFVDVMRQNGRGLFSGQQNRQTLFFRTTFQVMGHLAKSKGRVSEADIRVVTAFMDRMQLHGESRVNAQQAFREGKENNFQLEQKLRQLHAICYGRSDLIRIFFEIQVQVAFADGHLHPNEKQVLFTIAKSLGFSEAQFEQFISMIEGGIHFGQSGQSQSQHSSAYHSPTLEDACKVLGVKADDEANTIKRAYRKLMNEHHPDKLVARGLPPEMIEMAKQKAQDIQAAYDLIKQRKGFK